METNIKLNVLALGILIIALLTCSACMGQSNKQPYQNPQIQINCDLTVNGKKLDKTESMLITIIDNSLNSKEILVRNKLLYNLEYNKEYTVLFEYKDCQAKSIYFNNYTTKTDVLLTCYFTIDLKTSLKQDILTVAEVYYDKEQKDFTYKLTANFDK